MNSIMIFLSANNEGGHTVTASDLQGNAYLTMDFPTPTSQARFTLHREIQDAKLPLAAVHRALGAFVRQEAKGKLPPVVVEAGETVSEDDEVKVVTAPTVKAEAPATPAQPEQPAPNAEVESLIEEANAAEEAEIVAA